MVFSEQDKAVIKACVNEKGWSGNRILKEFPGKDWNRRSVYRLIKKIKETGSTDRKRGSGRPRTAQTEENEEAVEELILSQEDQPGTHMSQRKIADNLGISRTSVQRITDNLNLNSYKRIHVSRRDQNVRQKRKTRSRNLNDRYSAEDVKKIVFTDEKDFTEEIATNRQNDRVYGSKKMEIPPSRLYHESSRFSKKVMVSAGVSWNGKTQIHFIDTKTTKVNSESYMELLEGGLLPDCRDLYPEDDYVFQQDGAPSHNSNATQNYLEDATPSFIRKDEWPPQSPDLNPMDYAIWDSLKEKVYANRRDKFTGDELKEKIRSAWDEISLDEIRNCISSWKKRLRLVCSQDGGHIEHLLK